MSDWKDINECFHTLFHEDLFSKIGRIENRPRQLRIHQLYIWSDGFQKNTLVNKKTTSLQMFIMYAIPPDGTRNIARYTIPLALGKKHRHHRTILNEILHQTKSVERVASKYCGKSKKLSCLF